MERSALIFDLDGTLVDSVYQHVTIWHAVLRRIGVTVPAVEIHRRIGMTGPMMLDALCGALQLDIASEKRASLESMHGEEYAKVVHSISPLPGAPELLRRLAELDIRWAIATSAGEPETAVLTRALNIPSGATVITQRPGAPSKPSPDPFEAAAKRLRVPLERCMIVGDSVWDILASRRAGAFGIGLLSGGYGREELVAAGAYRVYNDAENLHERLTELGILEASA